MKVRAQRTHHMGSSNRTADIFNESYNKSKTIFDRSFIKSKSLHQHQSLDKTLPTTLLPAKTENPFAGTHNQLESKRFDKMNMRPYIHEKAKIPNGMQQINLSASLNEEVKGIKREFEGKKINMHKLKELKQAFIKNNRERRNLKPYFEKYRNEEGVIDGDSMRMIVREYGFDISDDEAKLIFRMTNRESDENEAGLNMNGFINLMTKDDVYFRTMRLNEKISDGKEQRSNNFSEKVHQVLRNKFPRLKEALKIYQTRGEEIDEEKFQKVMKKLDLTDLVLNGKQRHQIFSDYSQNGSLNPEALICAIAEQEHANRKVIAGVKDFSTNIDVNLELEEKKVKKVRNYSLKELSDVEYEKQLFKAQTVMRELKKVRQDKKVLLSQGRGEQEEKGESFLSWKESSIHREDLAKQVQKYLQKEGINFQKEDYDAFVSTFDFDINGQISRENAKNTVYFQTEKQARNRFERRTRNEMPKSKMLGSAEYDSESAEECIRRLREHKMNPENRELFQIFDKDLDGYIGQKQFRDNLTALCIMQNWEIDNLANYLSLHKGGISFTDFTHKINQGHNSSNTQLPFVIFKNNSKSCHHWSAKTADKKSWIKTMNQPTYQCPTKYSAWPSRLIQSDLSLMQPPPDAGTHATSDMRFYERKEEYGMKEKMKVQAIAESRRQRLMNWNNKLQERIEKACELEVSRQAARNYSLRLAQQKYEQNCHNQLNNH